MCLTLAAVEKYPFTDQQHFTSGAHGKGRECDTAKAGRPSPFAFPQRAAQVTGHLWSPNHSLESVTLLHQAARMDSCPFSLPALLSLWRAGGLTIFPVRRIPEDYWWPSRLELKSCYFPHSWAKTTESREFLSTVLAPYLLLSSLKTSNSAEFPYDKSMHGKTSGTEFIVLTGGEKTEQTLSVAGWQSASDRCPAQWPTWPNPSHPDPFRRLLAGNFTFSPPNGRRVVWYFLCSDFFMKILPCKSR